MKNTPIKRWIAQQNKEGRDVWIKQAASSTKPGSRILDIGAGGCPYRSLFLHCDYMTHDFSALSPDQLTQGGYGQIDYVSDAKEIPAPSASFDVILCTEVLEHVPEPDRVVAEIGRLLRPGGVTYLSAPLGSGLHQEPYHFYGGFTPHWYKRTLRAAGFDEVTIESNGGSYMHFAQWSVWFARNSAFWRIPAPWYICLAFLPVRLLCVPMLGFLFLACHGLDRYDRVRQFTVGYHVAARKATVGAPSAAARDRSA
jgi:SAM-dependent methyltransferase